LNYTYNLKEVTYITEKKYYQLTFKELEPTEAITYYDNETRIGMVNFNVIGQKFRGGLKQWLLDDGTPHYPDVEQNDMEFSYFHTFFAFGLRDDCPGYGVTNYKGTSTTVSIPSNINGIPVTIIDEFAFSGSLKPENQKLTSVTIPNSVKIIDCGAFSYNNLTNFTFPTSIKFIDYSVIANNQITSIIIPADFVEIGGGNTSMNSINGITIGANCVFLNPVDSLGCYYNDNNRLAGTYTWNRETHTWDYTP